MLSLFFFSITAFKRELWNLSWWKEKKENVQHAQALSQWSKLRCHWIKVASYLFEVSITPDTSTSNTVTRLILKPLSGEKLQSTVWCIVFAQKKGYVDFLQTASAGDSYGMWLAEESCWFSSFSFSQSLIRGLCLRGKCYLKPLSIKTRSAIRGKHPAKRELGSTNKKKKLS